MNDHAAWYIDPVCGELCWTDLNTESGAFWIEADWLSACRQW
jgi:hypothetical protein